MKHGSKSLLSQILDGYNFLGYTDMFCLNSDYSTTRLVTQEIPVIKNKQSDKFNSVLFLMHGEIRKGEGGLRTQGYFKSSSPVKPLITIITVVFNGKQYLEKTILSVIGQAYDNVEYIIIDGGSTDGTLDIIRKYEHSIDYWVSEQDKGLYDAMNKGISLSQGCSIGIINADDWYEPDVIDTIALYKDISNKIFHGDMKIYKDNNYQYTQKFYGNYKQLEKGMILSHSTMFVGVDIYKKYGCFDQDFATASDWDLTLRLYLAQNDFIYIPNILANFRLGGISYKVTLKSSLEKNRIRKKNKGYDFFDKYLTIDILKLIIFGKFVSAVSIFKNKYFKN